MAGSAQRVIRVSATMFTASISSIRLGSLVSNVPRSPRPALLIRTSGAKPDFSIAEMSCVTPVAGRKIRHDRFHLQRRMTRDERGLELRQPLCAPGADGDPRRAALGQLQSELLAQPGGGTRDQSRFAREDAHASDLSVCTWIA